MAAGDNWFNCADKNVSLEAGIRLMIREDANGDPCFTTNAATALPLYLRGGSVVSRNYLSTDQILRMMIIEDANGDPIWNISSL